MLSVSPISFNQNNRQNTPNFKGTFGLIGKNAHLASERIFSHPTIQPNVKGFEILDNSLGRFTFRCNDTLDTDVYKICHDIAQNIGDVALESIRKH